ncbi:1-acyl-sn-glycerol-3-phosphate acyltransferase [Gordonia desulfuricans]|uniref:1-acyl-sn-glycerol-3-phosphate acyltransferase n=1 Tax=Gordonia desulfuricans TaxID=89051 RepID=UPI00073E7538|nr:1-acyl-sn-glycerol-3-phosphate acyltransferase [Gordonia desulfuricans]
MSVTVDVTLNDFENVYDFYREHRQPVLKAKSMYAVLAAKYRPQVRYETGARQLIRHLRREGCVLVISANHVRETDPFVLAATGFLSAVRPHIGHVRVLAKDPLFVDPEQRRKIDLLGGIPVFRPKDHGVRETMVPGRRMIDICVERMVDGDWIAVFAEGTCNLTDPAHVQPLGSGMGHIVKGVIGAGRRVALLSIGIAYRENTDRGPAVMINRPIELTADDAKTPAAATRLAAADLQRAVDVAWDRAHP